MQRYYFHIDTSTGPIGDIVGRQLDSDDRAMHEAKYAATEELLLAFDAGELSPTIRVNVESSGRSPVATLIISAKVTAAAQGTPG